jgi:hypothetical protein
MDFENYYSSQAKEAIPVFRGAPYQRGSGFGSVFKKIFRWIIPIIKEHALPVVKSAGKEALKTALNIANDTIDGKDFVSSAKQQVKNSLNKFSNQYGNGKAKKKAKKKALFKKTQNKKKTSQLIQNKITKPNFSNKKKRKLDIFD